MREGDETPEAAHTPPPGQAPRTVNTPADAKASHPDTPRSLDPPPQAGASNSSPTNQRPAQAQPDTLQPMPPGPQHELHPALASQPAETAHPVDSSEPLRQPDALEQLRQPDALEHLRQPEPSNVGPLPSVPVRTEVALPAHAHEPLRQADPSDAAELPTGPRSEGIAQVASSGEAHEPLRQADPSDAAELPTGPRSEETAQVASSGEALERLGQAEALDALESAKVPRGEGTAEVALPTDALEPSGQPEALARLGQAEALERADLPGGPETCDPEARGPETTQVMLPDERAEPLADGAPAVPESATNALQPEIAPSAAQPQQVAEEVEATPGARVVRRVVCGYRLGWLPSDWLRTWRRLDRLLASADLHVKASLAPLEELPADTDILVVPPDLRDAAHAAALPDTPILVTPASSAAGAFADLVSRLEAGTQFTVERKTSEPTSPPEHQNLSQTIPA